MTLMQSGNGMGKFEFHVSRRARAKYQFDEQLFSLIGRVVLADFNAARNFAEKMSQVRGQVVPASDINAMGLIDEILHILIRQYEMQNPGIMQRALVSVGSVADSSLPKFIQDFPPMAVLHGEMDPAQYLRGETVNRSNRLIALEEMLILYITNQNPATFPYKDLFDDEILRNSSSYDASIKGLLEFFQGNPGFSVGNKGPENKDTLIDVLMAPGRIAPNSLAAQLDYLLQLWGPILGDGFVQKILRAMDFVKENFIRPPFEGGFAGDAPGIQFSKKDYSEYERFSPDKDWMPRLVMIAKNSYVWLDQLSKKYQREILSLSQIPDEELDLLHQRGITGLWLIGLWERSSASRRIKQMMGQADAVASAYSLMDYQIANDLGGWDALNNLRGRAWQHGIRLSADMVPNHMGIDSRWVVEHPDWFLSLPASPYSNYSFNGPDLSQDDRVGIQIEDRYYTKSDAAVVFKRLDRWTGDTRFIYHGNDGTSMPWNDTAQLDYSKAYVREAVIQTIIHIAQTFPIIRFDAAMTLAKKHIQRLWFPEPGEGGAIPSRAEHGMTAAQFEAAIPIEFWREVVDRIASEVPDTLLLAEAFWMMEGYFVRTLGMHRVYNSAFMHMLRDEDNAKYRQVIKNTLEFDPQILKRFVNFQNNPDEKTATEQFGTTDKYFGVCTLMVTLPGLPMFGHGQIEGYREKYGMEYRHAKWEESVDLGLVQGHEWRIFPLTHRRALFAGVENFRLYDFYVSTSPNSPTPIVNEDVFAYSNFHNNERSLVIYHNRYAETRGWIKTSAAWSDKPSGHLERTSLGEALFLPQDAFVVFKDFVSGLEYIRSSQELLTKGLYVELRGYQCHVFLDWRIEYGDPWKKASASLNGSGAPSINAMVEQILAASKETPVVMEDLPQKKLRSNRNKSNKAKNTKLQSPVKKK